VQEKLGAAIVAAGSQVLVTGGDLVAFVDLAVGFIDESIGEGAISVVSTAVIAGLDALGNTYNFTKQRPAVICGTK
jgi:hypothetical protein